MNTASRRTAQAENHREFLWTGTQDPAAVALKRREIAARYKARRRDSRGTGVAHIMRFRAHDLEWVIRDCHGDTLPENAVGRDLLFVLAHTVAGTVRRMTYGAAPTADHAAVAIMARVRQWAPWLSHSDAAELAERVLARPLRWTADSLARRIGLTYAKRTEGGITTIGACDVTKAERLARTRERKRAAKAAKRRQAGVPERAACASRTQPWVRLGMSRATWYRRGKPRADETRTRRETTTAPHSFLSPVPAPYLSHGGHPARYGRAADAATDPVPPEILAERARIRAVLEQFEAECRA